MKHQLASFSFITRPVMYFTHNRKKLKVIKEIIVFDTPMTETAKHEIITVDEFTKRYLQTTTQTTSSSNHWKTISSMQSEPLPEEFNDSKTYTVGQVIVTKNNYPLTIETLRRKYKIYS